MLVLGVGGVVWEDVLHLVVSNLGVALALEVSGQAILLETGVSIGAIIYAAGKLTNRLP
jgi:hypothetical protein